MRMPSDTKQSMTTNQTLPRKTPHKQQVVSLEPKCYDYWRRESSYQSQKQFAAVNRMSLSSIVMTASGEVSC